MLHGDEGDGPTYSTFDGISSRYSFWMRGGGRVGGARYSCWCPPCVLAFETREGIDNLLDVAACKGRHLMRYHHRGGDRYGYEEATITCTAASGIANARSRARQLWFELRPLLRAGKFAAVQAREQWSDEEDVHMRPGHFWVCELGDADGKGSPIIAGPFSKQEYWPPAEGRSGWEDRFRGIARLRYDAGECAILLRCYMNRTADDPEGLTFVRWKESPNEILVVNSADLRAVQGRQQCDFKLVLPKGAPQLRQQIIRGNKRHRSVATIYDPKQRWRLDRELDLDTRKLCEAT